MNHNRVVHCKQDHFDTYIGRPSKWGNPFSHLPSDIAKYEVSTRLEAVQSYAYWLQDNELIDDIHELVGKVLGCHCGDELCHGTVLAELADRYSGLELEETSLSDVQEIYKYIYDSKEHLYVKGDDEFIDTVKSVNNHINKTRNNKVIILECKLDTENTISRRIRNNEL